MGDVDLAVMLIELRQVPFKSGGTYMYIFHTMIALIANKNTYKDRPSLEGVVRSKKRVCKEEMSDEFEHYPIPCSKDRFRHCKDDY